MTNARLCQSQRPAENNGLSSTSMTALITSGLRLNQRASKASFPKGSVYACWLGNGSTTTRGPFTAACAHGQQSKSAESEHRAIASEYITN